MDPSLLFRYTLRMWTSLDPCFLESDFAGASLAGTDNTTITCIQRVTSHTIPATDFHWASKVCGGNPVSHPLKMDAWCDPHTLIQKMRWRERRTRGLTGSWTGRSRRVEWEGRPGGVTRQFTALEEKKKLGKLRVGNRHDMHWLPTVSELVWGNSLFPTHFRE